MTRIRLTSLFHDANLVGLYEVDNGALTTDSSGNGNTLTNSNSVATDTTNQKYGTAAADFGTANTNKSLIRASALGFTNNQSRTLVGWVKVRTELSGADSFNSFIAIDHADIDIVFRIGYWRESSVNKVVVNRGKNGVGTTGIKTSTNLGTTNWHHVALTWNGTTLEGFLDGSSFGTETPGTGSGSDGFVDGFTIGSDSAASPVSFSSVEMDDVAIFSRVLTSAEILNLASEPGTTTSTSTSTSTTTTSTSTTTTSTSTTTTSTSSSTTTTSTSSSTSTSTTTTSTSTSTTTTSTSSSTTTSTSTTTTSTSSSTTTSTSTSTTTTSTSTTITGTTTSTSTSTTTTSTSSSTTTTSTSTSSSTSTTTTSTSTTTTSTSSTTTVSVTTSTSQTTSSTSTTVTTTSTSSSSSTSTSSSTTTSTTTTFPYHFSIEGPEIPNIPVGEIENSDSSLSFSVDSGTK